MKRFGLILAVCLAFVGLYAARADDAGDVARATTRRVSSVGATVTGRQVANSTSSRGGSTTAHTTQNVRGRNNTTSSRQPAVTERAKAQTSSRTGGNVVSRTTAGSVATRTTNPTARSTTRNATTTKTTKTSSRTVSRATTTGTVTREDILNRDYSKCKTVFFDCMDEFCANKDSQLKRCACSSRINEFDSVKKQLAAVEDKMLDFNQRLLTVSMDKEDAAALSVATEGETAYLATKDSSDSKKALDAIAKKLNTSFDSSNFNSDLNVLSWSLDIDSAFDNVDSLMGASTTTKTGTALYAAALPICRTMAAEVCNATDVSLAEGGYQALIEQDCNTVAKTYQTQAGQARAQVLEGGALLDMSRLDVYQKQNSDDILTCKKKMLDMLTDSTVCGDGLGRCLDISGKYIDPSTGEVFLTTNLKNLTSLLTRPTGDATWSSTAQNSGFVSFLNSKKKFLQPAMEHCQTIADAVWDDFVEDALAQIKLAQEDKLNEVRQSCTVLTAQCLSNAFDSITDFDARALSIFGVAADKTANAMCSNIINSCSALLEESGQENTWQTGVSAITIATTYDTLMQTCAQVGRACIIQVCNASSGNFGLCEDISASINRKSIINRNACWQDVYDCIASTGKDNIDKIIDEHLGLAKVGKNTNNALTFYDSMYGTYDDVVTGSSDTATINTCSQDVNKNCIYDICADKCSGDDTTECRTCRLAEKLWGNCEVPPTTQLYDSAGTTSHNKIKSFADTTNQSLLYWFAVNTGTDKADDSCRDTTCGPGYVLDPSGMCIRTEDMCFTVDKDNELAVCENKVNVSDSSSLRCMCCSTQDSAGNCCESGQTISETFTTNNTDVLTGSVNFCAPTDGVGIVLTEPYTVVEGGSDKYVLICYGDVTTVDNTLTCSGPLVRVTIINNKFYYGLYSGDDGGGFVKNVVYSKDGTPHYAKFDDQSALSWSGISDISIDKWAIKFNE